MFHLVTHASFKALLFLTAGVVIHALHGREELAVMGGLRKALPGAYAAFLVGSLALIGVPLSSGAFSKDAILDAAQAHDPLGGDHLDRPVHRRSADWPVHGPPVLHRLPRAAPLPGELHRGAPQMESAMLWSLVPLAIGAIFLGYLDWPVPILANMLGGVVGEAEAVQPSLMGLVAGALGLAGFGLAYWQVRSQCGRPARAGSRHGCRAWHRCRGRCRR